MTRNRARCPAHGQQNPCTGCAGDHLAGAHEPGSRRRTCRRCRTRPRARSDPIAAAAPRRPTWPQTDVAALAANDTDLTQEDA